MTQPLPFSDLDDILSATVDLWDELRGERLFLTGGTGFFGKWLIESFLHANQALRLNASAVVLTRNPNAFRAAVPHLATHPAITLFAGDVRETPFPTGSFGLCIHAATEASASQLANRPREMLSTLVEGTGRVLAFAERAGVRKLLLTSSGAVYGPQPSELERIPEDFGGAPNPLSPSSVYGEGKRMAELLASLVSPTLQVKVARCFAFVGPHLPLDTHFAAGNFLADALAGGPISIAGDGTTLRSYLYASDLMAWLWTILFRGAPLRAYNVGSEEAISIAGLARAVASTQEPPLSVTLVQQPLPGKPASRYIPSTERAHRELGLRQTVTLDDALRRTLAWHRLRS